MIGDKVLLQKNTEMVPAIVMNISTIKMQGNSFSKELLKSFPNFALFTCFVTHLVVFNFLIIQDSVTCELSIMHCFVYVPYIYVTAAVSGTEYSGEWAASDLLVTCVFTAALGNSCLAWSLYFSLRAGSTWRAGKVVCCPVFYSYPLH